ncbi:2,3-diketo-5-methylthio-1-phosphopentane phosphatase [Parvibaculum lavamentivorans DS-1]|uniref:Enolase-phosphatase E1 n=1 Tax=Parvibaculum lavamentivorans (strain DS-1 / DSM 13023 / NCIMB 13966) TaxID=402881 RepID=MTNC_PARL1|nr:acireductone synthase [Parvibaculum lavamentivorans]A7HU88.1 RecName: Full=Enolase-phosphatase E1; AltName: Full=2,3-diketo-5-methylthio-1-phosphopentane phosphatase [Parvibaculum lavamentivorans DS-1]ABS63471.1 2,3-diketo-5-methylthio-1-phosphopentane phosphatase [Parvibaculum lavamentivorans DS-1]
MTAVRAVVTDIEGTTTPLAFVHEVLFPYARARLADFVAANADDEEVAAALGDARELGGIAGAGDAETLQLLLAWMDEDRKAGPLKLLQGLIWRHGYEEGVLKGEIYADAAAALRLWHGRGLRLFVYSSGSEAAQRLIFGHSDQGDLGPCFEGYFDTRIGAKVDSASYAAIAQSAGLPTREVLFLSDHEGEIKAAREAGMQAVTIDRTLQEEAWMEGPKAGSFSAVERALAPGKSA